MKNSIIRTIFIILAIFLIPNSTLLTTCFDKGLSRTNNSAAVARTWDRFVTQSQFIRTVGQLHKQDPDFALSIKPRLLVINFGNRWVSSIQALANKARTERTFMLGHKRTPTESFALGAGLYKNSARCIEIAKYKNSPLTASQFSVGKFVWEYTRKK